MQACGNISQLLYGHKAVFGTWYGIQEFQIPCFPSCIRIRWFHCKVIHLLHQPSFSLSTADTQCAEHFQYSSFSFNFLQLKAFMCSYLFYPPLPSLTYQMTLVNNTLQQQFQYHFSSSCTIQLSFTSLQLTIKLFSPFSSSNAGSLVWNRSTVSLATDTARLGEFIAFSVSSTHF